MRLPDWIVNGSPVVHPVHGRGVVIDRDGPSGVQAIFRTVERNWMCVPAAQEMGGLELDLNDRTGRIHAAWWLLSRPAERIPDPNVGGLLRLLRRICDGGGVTGEEMLRLKSVLLGSV